MCPAHAHRRRYMRHVLERAASAPFVLAMGSNNSRVVVVRHHQHRHRHWRNAEYSPVHLVTRPPSYRLRFCWLTSLCSASSLARRHDTSRIYCRAMSPAIDQYLLAAGRSAANSHHAAAAVDRCDRRTDRQTGAQPFHKPSFAYYALQAVTMN